MSASMPVKDYKDWSPPSCSIVSWGRSWMSDGSMYDVFYTVRHGGPRCVVAVLSTNVSQRENHVRAGKKQHSSVFKRI